MLFHQKPNAKAPRARPAHWGQRVRQLQTPPFISRLYELIQPLSEIWHRLEREAEVQPARSYLTIVGISAPPIISEASSSKASPPGLRLSHFLISSILPQTASISSRKGGGETSAESGLHHFTVLQEGGGGTVH